MYFRYLNGVLGMRSSYCAGLPNADLSTCLQAALRYLGEYLSANLGEFLGDF